MKDLSVYRKLAVFVFAPALFWTTSSQADLIDGEDLVDPTRPLFVSTTADSEVMAMIRNVIPASYDLSFIRSGSSPVAVINQERVTVGDQIGGATVVSIDRSSVTLSINGTERRISLYEDTIKSPATQ